MMKRICAEPGCTRPTRKREWCSRHYGQHLKAGDFTPRPKMTETERFWSKVDKDGPTMPHMTTSCWIWGAVVVGNYGQFVQSNGDRIYANRWAYISKHGDLGPGQLACHECDNPICVNPDHLFSGTHADNCDDKIAKGRQYAILTEADVLSIRARRSAGERGVDLAAEFGVAQQTICNIVKGRRWERIM